MTSGVGGIYSPGIPVAMVVKVDKDTTIARPIADPAKVDRAIVQHVFQPAANQPLSAAEPPAPTVPAPAEALQDEE
jgi:rod shape-determining protein MreC